ncbi:MAG: transglutaminase domain-containing protein [Acidobacteriota bacterium]
MFQFVFPIWLTLFAATSGPALAASSENGKRPHPSDARTHTEVIQSSRHSFEIDVKGTIAPENLEILIENKGSVPVKNPRVTINGQYNWYTLEGMVEEITRGATTDEEKAMALFHFVARQSYWWTHPKDRTAFNPVRFFNNYGYHVCAQAASALVGLCRAAGLEARVYEIWHHTVAEVKWDGAWHQLDPDFRTWYLKDDNKTIASMADLERHPEWVARSFKPSRWFLSPDDGRKVVYRPEAETVEESWANNYGTSEDNYVEGGYDAWIYQVHTMDLTLRPEEKLVRWWRPVLRKYYDRARTQEPPRYANGQLIFEPDFTRHTYDGLIGRTNIRFKKEDGQSPSVHVAKPQDGNHDQPSSLRIPIRSPYVIVGGYIDSKYYKGGTTSLDTVALSANLDPIFHQSTPLWNYISWAVGAGRARSVLDEKLAKDGPGATYGFEAIYSISANKKHEGVPPQYPLIYGGQSGLDQVRIVADLQVNPGSLPALSLGKNIIQYTDETPGDHEVRITYKWRERYDQRAPEAPSQGISPKPGARLSTLTPALEWLASNDADGDPIVSYHVQVSLRPDCLWSVASALDREIRDGTRFQIPPGWLKPKTTYYWRVRAEDDKGNLSSWSKILHFTTPDSL